MKHSIRKSMAIVAALAVPWSPTLAEDDPRRITDPQELQAVLEICAGGVENAQLWERAREACTAVIVSPAAEESDKFAALMSRGRIDFYDGWTAQAHGDFTDAIALRPDSADAHYWRGQVLDDIGNQAEDALREYDTAISLSPGFADAHVARGRLLAGRQDYEEAVAAYGRAIDLEPKAGTFVLRGQLYARLGKEDLALADFDRAIALANGSLVVDAGARKGKADILYRRAGALFDEGAYEQAVAAYDAALAVEYRSSGQIRRGEAYYALGQYHRALEDFDNVLADARRGAAELKREAQSGGRGGTRAAQLLARGGGLPQDAVDGRKKALCRLEGRTDCDAQSTSRDTAAVDAEAGDAAAERALTSQCQGEDAAQAIDACSRLLESEDLDEQRRAHLRHMRGKAYAQANKGMEAFRDFTAAAERSANPEQVLLDRGQLLLRAKQYNDAIKDFTAAARLKDGYGPAYFYRAKANLDAGQLEQGERDLDYALQYLEKDSESELIAQTHVMKGNLNMGRRAFQPAAQEYLKAVQIASPAGTVRLFALERLGQACYSGGQYDVARDVTATLIELRPDYAPAYNTRGMAYIELGEQDLAIADFDKAISLDPEIYTYAYLNNRGTAYVNKGELALAIDDFDEAIRRKPDYETARRNRAEAAAALAKKQ